MGITVIPLFNSEHWEEEQERGCKNFIRLVAMHFLLYITFPKHFKENILKRTNFPRPENSNKRKGTSKTKKEKGCTKVWLTFDWRAFSDMSLTNALHSPTEKVHCIVMNS